MENENTEKRVWQTPEVVDLDVDKTQSGVIGNLRESKYSYS